MTTDLQIVNSDKVIDGLRSRINYPMNYRMWQNTNPYIPSLGGRCEGWVVRWKNRGNEKMLSKEQSR